MNIDSPNFKDGKIEQVGVTADCVTMKISCAKVEGGELTVDINSNPDGWIYIHFSGLGSKKIEVANQGFNGLDVFVKE